jgi:hypothetical protein
MIPNFPLYLKHKITAYHLRDKFSRKGTVLAICNCGYSAWWFRKHKYKILHRRLLCIFGHQWDEWDNTEVGEIYEDEEGYHSTIDDGEGTVIGTMRQCERCWKVETKNAN